MKSTRTQHEAKQQCEIPFTWYLDARTPQRSCRFSLFASYKGGCYQHRAVDLAIANSKTLFEARGETVPSSHNSVDAVACENMACWIAILPFMA